VIGVEYHITESFFVQTEAAFFAGPAGYYPPSVPDEWDGISYTLYRFLSLHAVLPYSLNKLFFSMYILRTNVNNPDLEKLIPLLDKELEEADGVEDHPFFAQFNKLDDIKHIVIAYDDGIPVGCGALKKYDELTGEIKRMFVLSSYRGKGIASRILKELETWAEELGFRELILETGKTQAPAINLYERNNYKVIPNYGQYAGVEKSLCMKKFMVGQVEPAPRYRV
jgi:GNAT superfamily N-acetyltransferase